MIESDEWAEKLMVKRWVVLAEIKGIPSANCQIYFCQYTNVFVGGIGKVCSMNQIQCASIVDWVMGQLKSDMRSTFIQYSWTGQRLKNGPISALLLSEDL